MLKYFFCLALMSITFLQCNNAPATTEPNLQELSWKKIEQKAKGSTVQFMMWQGSSQINKYMNYYIRPALKEKYDIDLQITGGQGPEIVQLLMGEKQANARSGQVDMAWINGETFFQLRQIDGLYGPFVEKLPNAKYIDFTNPFIGIDFQQEVAYMECPWTITQFAMIHDAEKVPDPPSNLEELERYVKENPGTFTITNDFSGMTLLKSFLAELSGSPTGLNGEFDEEKYKNLSSKLWEYINRNKKYFWKQGRTFPKEQSKVDQMVASGEILLAYGFGEGSIDDKVEQGLYPKTIKGYPWDYGTIKNSNYMGITYNSPNKAGAMVVINFLISPEAQLKKSDPNQMDANTVLDIDRLPTEWKEKFENRQLRQYGPSLEELEDAAIQEPDPQYMIRLFDDFRSEVIEK